MAERELPRSETVLERSLPRAAYVEPAFFERERAAIFAAEWCYAGRLEQFEHAGAFVALDLAGESVVVVRGDEGELYAHLNLCRHRGSRLVCGSGTLRGAIRCPYHGWAYAFDGTLIASPFVAAADRPADVGRLHPVAVDSWGGFVFVHLDPERARRETLAAQLGPVPERLRRYPLAALRTGRSFRYDVRANWKVLLENYNECYHCAGVHPELCQVVPAFKRRGGAGLDWERGIPHRDGAWTFSRSGSSDRLPFPGLDDDERVRHKGELIYPNFMLSLSADHVAAFSVRPREAGETEIVCDLLFHPDEIGKPGFDPSDAAEFWDLVNRQDWTICERVQAGMRSRAFAYGYYAPMEDASLDIRRYVAAHLGQDAVATE
ncbi:MAG TPA: aromatic ring-hydroxylating dioxygenase subunit alpha [Candidatus Tumulicola sp.]